MSLEKPREGVNFNKSSPLLNDLFKQKTAGFLCDVELHLQDNIIQVHGCVLASQSEYFSDRFCPQIARGSSWDKHWCAVRPLVIHLDSEMDIDEHCFTCLSQVIDYVYLKELFVKEGHSLHSYKYAYFFKIPELLALCKTYDKNLRLENEAGNKVKSGRESQPIKNSSQECLTQGSVSQANTNNEEKCEFICCSKDLEPSVKKGKGTKKRSISCELCDFKTVSMKTMRKHVESSNHYGTRCPICRLQIPNVAQLTDHLMLHEGAKPYICHICNKRTRFWDDHKLHLRVHCRNKPFCCSICQTRFKEEKNLVVHMKSHSVSCYSCEHCAFITSEFKIFKAHLMQHSARLMESNECVGSACSESIAAKNAPYNLKKFICQACGEGFTLQKNLKRHVLLKHFGESQDLKCPKCNYLAKRLDMLKKHLTKRHRHLEPIEIDQIMKGYRNCLTAKRNKTIKNSKENSEILGVLIPVQLVSTSDKTTLNAFAVKNDETLEGSVSHENDNPPITFHSEELINSIEVSCDSPHQNSTPEEFHSKQSHEKHMKTNYEFSTLPLIDSEHTTECLFDLKRPRKDTKATGDRRFIAEDQQVPYTLSEEDSGVGTADEIWLNESTGELLSGSGYVNLHLLHSEGSIRQDISSLRKGNLDIGDSYKTLLLNDQTGEISVHDINEAKDDYFSNPQTPQTNVFDIDDTENLISWNCLESPFCSTWVLNEATGELNMVSFSVKSLDNTNSDKLELNKSSDGSSYLDDDDTALFLNEGTGDLSVIYFNPKDSRGEFSDAIGQDTLETMSDHSDDEDIDFLNEELLRVSANFMVDDGNEKFLNELTGEFDVASFSRFQTDVMAYQTADNSMMYLNEETGEISWNVMDQDANSDIVTTNSDILNLDFDDSINCEDLDNFPTKTDFSSEFCIENSASSDWQNLNESCDTLLNECTGEMVQKIISI